MGTRIVRILLLASLLPVGAQGVAHARSSGQVLPELSGRGIGPGDDPRVRRRARIKRRGRKLSEGRELRKRSRPRYRSVRLTGGGWRFYSAGWSAVVEADGSVRFDQRVATWSQRNVRLRFDITDAALRGKKKDPYVAAKLRFMRATAAWRLGLRRAAKRRARRLFFALLPARLRGLWQRTDISTMRKRTLLFELWQECLEPGRTTDSVKAQQARWMILRFIQKHLPAGRPGAYTKRELRRMQKRRRGRIQFDPYGRLRRPILPKPVDTGR